MARIRSIKPEFWVSEQIAECSTSARLTFVGLWNFCDDNGVHPAKPKTLKAELFPMDDITSTVVSEWVAELVSAGLVAEFEAGGTRYWHVTGWAKHQKIERPSCKYPTPPNAKTSPSPRRALAEHSPSPHRSPPPGEDRRGEDRSREEVSPPAKPSAAPPPVAEPTNVAPAVTSPKPKIEKEAGAGARLDAGWALPDDWRAWALNKRPDLDPHQCAERFANHWHSQAGQKGRKADWFATLRNWIIAERGYTAGAGRPLQGNLMPRSGLAADVQLMPGAR